MSDAHHDSNPDQLVRRHLRFGWWSLLLFLTIGILLEGLLAFKVTWYDAEKYGIRRWMWRLAHAHGALIALVHIGFALTVFVDRCGRRSRRIASPCLMAASVLLPGGFFTAGIFFFEGDPGLGIFLVPVGAAALFVAVLLIALACLEAGTTDSHD